MTEAELAELLSAVRRQSAEIPLEYRPPSPACLSYARARAVALNPRRVQKGEREHLEGCRRCRRLTESFAREMPHLPLRILARARLGHLTREEERIVDYHLHEGECEKCGERTAWLTERLEYLVSFSASFTLSPPAALSAAAPRIGVRAHSPNRALEVEFFEEAGAVSLEVRTKDSSLNHHLVGYWLSGASGERTVSGFMILRPDVESWHTADARLEPVELFSQLGGRCEEALVSLVAADLLTGQERESLLASIGSTLGEPEVRSAWEAWLEDTGRSAESLSPDTRQLLVEARALLEH